TFLILRAISIEFRSKEEMTWWKKTWDIVYSISSMMLAVLLGVVLGNVLQGIEVGQDYLYEGKGFFEFLNPYSVLMGITTLSLFMLHGAIYLLVKTEDRLFQKIRVLVRGAIIFFLLSFAITTIYTLLYIPHMSDKIRSSSVYFILPLLAFLAIANIPRLVSKHRYRLAFLFSSLTIALMLLVVALELYPNLLLSTLSPAYNLSIYDAASSTKTLKIMLLMVAVGGPLVATYTLFVY